MSITRRRLRTNCSATRSNCGTSPLCPAEVRSIPEMDDARLCTIHPLKSQR